MPASSRPSPPVACPPLLASEVAPVTTSAPDPDPSALRTRRLALGAAAAALSAWALDTAGVTVALPVMQTDLGITITAAQWVLNLAFLALAGLVTLGGWLGDRKGRVTVFRVGLLVFGAASVVAVAAGLAGSYSLLLAARFAAGAGAAMFVPAGTALLIDVYPADQRGAATGKAFAITMLVTTGGPMLAGAIVQGIGWPWVFVPGLLVALLALAALTRISLPAHEARPDQPRLDIVGAVLLFLAVATIIDGFMQAGAEGLTAPSVVAAIGFGLALGAGWIWWELRSRAPLLDPRVVRNGAVLLALVVSFMRFLPSTLGGVFLARYVQEVLGFPPAVAGLALVPGTLATFLVAGAAGKLFDRLGIRPPVTFAVGAMAASAAFYAVGYGQESYLVLAIGMVVGGVALAFSNVVTPHAVGSVGPERRGAIAALMPLAGQFATALWLAVITALLVSLGGSADPAQAQVDALPTIGWLATGALLVTLAVVLVLTREATAPTHDHQPW
jgi:MFS family permease